MTREETIQANENGYVVYPSNLGFMDLDEAGKYAIEASAVNPNEDFRIECCDTEKVLDRFRAGECRFPTQGLK